MTLRATILDGKIQVIVEREEKIEKTLKLKQSTIDQLDEMRSDWGVTNSGALDFIVETFYNMYKKPIDSERDRQQYEKELRIQKTIELRKLKKYTRKELAELVGVSNGTMSEYITEINKRNSL